MLPTLARAARLACRAAGGRYPPRRVSPLPVATIPPAPSRWVKADLHLHTAEDPEDPVDFSAADAVEMALARGFGALAITLHGRRFWDEALAERAAVGGLRLIPGAELRLEGADVVVLGLSASEAAATRTFADLARLRAHRGPEIFCLAPHPFFFLGASMGGRRLRTHAALLDAVEWCHFHTRGLRWLDRNRPARRAAARLGKPLVATSDAHATWMFGEHHSIIEAPVGEGAPSVADLFVALRAGRVRNVSPAGNLRRMARVLAYCAWSTGLRWRGCPEASEPRTPEVPA